MNRNYDAQSLIEMPRVNSAAALTVSSSIRAAARAEKKLADNVSAALKSVVAAHDILQTAVYAAAHEETPGTFLEESRAEASAWSAAHTWAMASTKLKSKKKAELAAKRIT